MSRVEHFCLRADRFISRAICKPCVSQFLVCLHQCDGWRHCCLLAQQPVGIAHWLPALCQHFPVCVSLPLVKSHWCELCVRGWPCNVTLFAPFVRLSGLHQARSLVNSCLVDSLVISGEVNSPALVSSLFSDAASWHGSELLADPVAVLTRENTICPQIGSQRKTSPVWDEARQGWLAADPI